MQGRWIAALRRGISRRRDALTLGVRGLVISSEDGVLLVKHSYASGWHLPGGGVEPGESFEEALARELKEEANVELTGPGVLHGLFYYPLYSNRDHVALYVVRHFRQERLPEPNREIIACRFYPVDRLPPDTTAGTRRRIEEVFRGSSLPERW